MKVDIAEQPWLPNNRSRLSADITITIQEAKEIERTRKLNLLHIVDHSVTGAVLRGSSIITFVPKDFFTSFPNMTALCIYNCKIEKVSRIDFKGLKALKHLAIKNSQLQELPGDLFADMENIEIISFYENRIKFIGKDIFSNLKNLKHVNLLRNPTIDAIYGDREFLKTCELLHYDEVRNPTKITKFKEFNAILNGLYHTKSQVAVDLENVIKLNVFKDFTIKIGENELKVHKLMLAARSPTFAEMIINNPDADELILEDIEIEVFKTILDYIYTGKMTKVFEENSLKIYSAASKLKLENLKKHMGKVLNDNVDQENSFEMLKLGLKCNDERLKRKAFGEIKKNFSSQNIDEDLIDKPEVLKKLIDTKIAYDEKLRQMNEEFERILRNGK